MGNAPCHPIDTIYAPATAVGKAGVSIVRLSGPEAHSIGAEICGNLPRARHARLRTLSDKEANPIDRALVLRFDKDASFTAEPVVEFHVHGSPAIVRKLMTELGLRGARLAEPGEFTRRALENGALDLAQVEGLGDVLNAQTEAQRAQAMRLFQGELSRLAATWRADLIHALALIAVTIDFSDEDVPQSVSEDVAQRLTKTREALEKQRSSAHAARQIRDGFEVAILGPPNVGKSSLINALSKREVAIVSDIAGTTRDVLEVRLDLSGLSVTVLDTAGLRDTTDAIEQIGVDRAQMRAKSADLRIFLTLDGAYETNLYRQGDLIIGAQADWIVHTIPAVSSVTGSGIDAIIETLTERLQEQCQDLGSVVSIRQEQAVSQAITALEAALHTLRTDANHTELVTEEIHRTIRALDFLIGKIDLEVVLDDIFSSFCLGK